MADTSKSNLLHEALSKAPQATLICWLVKICATTRNQYGKG